MGEPRHTLITAVLSNTRTARDIIVTKYDRLPACGVTACGVTTCATPRTIPNNAVVWRDIYLVARSPATSATIATSPSLISPVTAATLSAHREPSGARAISCRECYERSRLLATHDYNAHADDGRIGWRPQSGRDHQ